jgi:glutathione S-transferase
MTDHIAVAFVTIASLLLYLVMGFRVGQARGKYGVEAPAISGHSDFERVFRVQANTLEWMPLYLPSLWLFAFYGNDLAAAGLGVIWIIGRTLYMTGYSKAAGARSVGFIVQGLATLILMIGTLVSLAILAVHKGG